MNDRSEVAVVKGNRIDQMVREAVSMVGGIGSVVKSGDSVLVKPNICLPLPPEKGDSTNHEVISALVRLFPGLS